MHLSCSTSFQFSHSPSFLLKSSREDIGGVRGSIERLSYFIRPNPLLQVLEGSQSGGAPLSIMKDKTVGRAEVYLRYMGKQ